MNMKEFDLQWNARVVAGGDTLDLSTDDGDVKCVVDEVDGLACTLKKLSYFSQRIGDAPIEKLEALGSELCRRVTYLMEPLGLVEIDRAVNTVQLRSTPPARVDDCIRYFEVAISPERGLSLQRFEAPRREARSMIPAAMTRETLERLIGDCFDATKLIV